jgi:hypothetical protein
VIVQNKKSCGKGVLKVKKDVEKKIVVDYEHGKGDQVINK